MSTFYARITPTNGVSGDIYSVSISGVTGTVEGQKTWTSGSLAFAITPTGSGTMVITFRNVTLNTVVGTKTVTIANNEAVPLGNLNMGSMTITCGRSNRVGTANIYYYGYGKSNDGSIYGSVVSNTAKYYETPLSLENAWVSPSAEAVYVSLRFLEANAIPTSLKLNIIFTNLTTTETISFEHSVHMNWLGGLLMGTIYDDPADVGKWKRIFTIGQQVKIDFIPLPAAQQV